MKYDTIFRRFHEGLSLAPPDADISAEARRIASTLQHEIAKTEGAAVAGRFRIRLTAPLVLGCFIEINLEHFIPGGWQTRAIGCIDHKGKREPFFITRSESLGGERLVTISPASREMCVSETEEQLFTFLEQQAAIWKSEAV